MKNKVTLILENFEMISEPQENNLVGGFSKSFSIQNTIPEIDPPSNNCWSGNCAYACGGNVSCNTVAGCGG